MVRSMTDQDGKAIQLLGVPFKVGGTATFAQRPPPRLGEHTEQVLREFVSLSSADIAELRERGVI